MSLPAYLDIRRLCDEISISERTADAWVRQGILPAPKLRGGKRLWKWAEVERYLDDGGPDASATADPEAERIRNGTLRMAEEATKNRRGYVRHSDPGLPRKPDLRGAGE